MIRKILSISIIFLIILSLGGCARTSGLHPETKGPKLILNASYAQGLLLAKEALKAEPIRFENAIFTPDLVRLKGFYTDGRILELAISKISDVESNLWVHVDNSVTADSDGLRILEIIMQYSNQRK